MSNLKLAITIDIDDNVWGTSEEERAYLHHKVLSLDSGLFFHSNEIGDTIGEVISIEVLSPSSHTASQEQIELSYDEIYKEWYSTAFHEEFPTWFKQQGLKIIKEQSRNIADQVLSAIYQKITCNGSREMTEERFIQAVGEVLKATLED